MQRLITNLENATQSIPGSISPATVLDALDGWDSLGKVAFTQVVSAQSKVDLTVDDLHGCSTVSDLQALLESRAAR